MRGVLEAQEQRRALEGVEESVAAENDGMLSAALGADASQFTPTQAKFAETMGAFRAGNRPKAVDKGYAGFRIPSNGREPQVP